MRKPELVLSLTLILSILSAIAISEPSMGSFDVKANNSGSSLNLEFPNSPMLVSDSTLGLYLKKYSSFVLDCWEPGCNPCQLIDPKIDQMARDFRGIAAFGKLNIKQNVDTKARFRVSSYPTLLLFKNGVMIYRHIGNSPVSTLEEIISKKLEINKTASSNLDRMKYFNHLSL